VAKVEEWKPRAARVSSRWKPQRAYPTAASPHLLGYVREASDEQPQGRALTAAVDMVGQTGLERLLDEFLRGKGRRRAHSRWIAMGRQIRLVQSTEPNPGPRSHHRRPPVQEVAEKGHGSRPGAIVV